MTKKAGARWLLLACVLLWGVALHPAAVLAQTCGPADVHQQYSGTVTLHNGPGCAGATQIPLAIRGPDHEAWEGYFYFGAPANVGCPIGTLDFFWAATGGHSGRYNFLASLQGYWPSDPAGSATCSESLCGCEGTVNIELYPIDEQLEIRSCPGVGSPVSVLTGNVWLD